MRLLINLLILAAAPGIAGKMERSLPLFFLPNTGQLDSSIRYAVETPELRAGFTRTGATFQIHGTNIRISFPGANHGVSLDAAEPLDARASLFYGSDPRQWRTAVP